MVKFEDSGKAGGGGELRVITDQARCMRLLVKREHLRTVNMSILLSS